MKFGFNKILVFKLESAHNFLITHQLTLTHSHFDKIKFHFFDIYKIFT